MSFDVFTAQNKPPPQSSSNSQAERIAFLIFVLILVLNSTWAFVSTLPCMIRLPKLHRGEICLDSQTRKKILFALKRRCFKFCCHEEINVYWQKHFLV